MISGSLQSHRITSKEDSMNNRENTVDNKNAKTPDELNKYLDDNRFGSNRFFNDYLGPLTIISSGSILNAPVKVDNQGNAVLEKDKIYRK